MRRSINQDVVSAAIDRMKAIYREGHRIVVSTSGGKDSTCLLEVCVLAARETGRLPIEVIHRDEEIIHPGTPEYLERLAQREDILFHWVYANQPMLNCFNRTQPYWWIFDPLLDESEWVRRPPPFAYKIDGLSIDQMTIPERFPPPPGKRLYAAIGLRAQESHQRLMGLFSSGSYITKPNHYGVANLRPLYDWLDGDVWKFIKDGGYDYSSAYDTMIKMGFPKNRIRIAPPTMNAAGIETLQLLFNAFPGWADRVNRRLPGLRTAARFGKRVVTPQRRPGETWKDCFIRECIIEAPAKFIRERSEVTMKRSLSNHAAHSDIPFMDANRCRQCRGSIRSWRDLARALYNGDPFSHKVYDLPAIDPEYFRAGSGVWSGSPSF